MPVDIDKDALVAKARKAAQKALIQSAEAVREEAIHLILDTVKSGVIYVRGDKVHQASAPDEPPASDTGTLVNRIDTEYDLDNLTAKVNAATSYAAFLEFGTSRMEARPFMRPALVNKLDEIKNLFKGFLVNFNSSEG